MISKRPACDLGFPCRDACCRKSRTWFNFSDEPLRQLATGVSPVAKLVATIFHSINQALYPSDPTENDRIMTVAMTSMTGLLASPMYNCTGLALVLVVVVMY